jgi:hypothetical protein
MLNVEYNIVACLLTARNGEIWSQVPRRSDPRMTALARTSSNCKQQARTLVREAPHIKLTTL